MVETDVPLIILRIHSIPSIHWVDLPDSLHAHYFFCVLHFLPPTMKRLLRIRIGRLCLCLFCVLCSLMTGSQRLAHGFPSGIRSLCRHSSKSLYPTYRIILQHTATRSSSSTLCFQSKSPDSETRPLDRIVSTITQSPKRTGLFSLLMTLAGAGLGPFLDSYHSAFGVLQYDKPITAILWGNADNPALITSWWVPELFGVAGFLIGWLYILGDGISSNAPKPSPPKILIGISIFTFQYWLSGLLYQSGVDRATILNSMSIVAATGFALLDSTFVGFLTSAATALGGPLIEVGLLTLSRQGLLFERGYHYTDVGETGFFPLWILPVYWLGGPAVGNLARGVWQALTENLDVDKATTNGEMKPQKPPGCTVCNDTRRVPCPNCDGVGTYVATGGRTVQCTSCRGRGFVVCRACFDYYDEDPADIEAIRDLISRMPD